MTLNIRKIPGDRIVLAFGLLLVPLAALAQTSALPLRSDYWSDPAFIKKFTYSYAPDTSVDPTITSEEKELFDLLLPIIRSDPHSAISMLRTSILPESSAALDFTLGNLYFETGDFAGATNQYILATTKFPNFLRAYNVLGKVKVRTGKLAEAIPYFVKTIELGGADGDIYGLLGYCYLNQQNVTAAHTAYDQALLYAPESDDWKLGKAQCVLLMQKWQEAITMFEELMKETPDKVEYWLLQANAYLGLGNTEMAAANYEVLRRMGAARPDSLFQLGDIYINDGLANLAYPVYTEALKADPNQGERRPLIVAEILVGRGTWNDAITFINNVRGTFGDRLSDEGELDLLTLESQIALATGDNDKAVATLQKIIDRNPLAGDALLLLAGFEAKNKQIEEAIFHYEAAREVEKYELRALLDHAQMFVRLARYSDAVPLIRDYLEVKKEDRIEKYLEAVERAAEAQQL
jgi:tetratricopeptide (TPR) repeat protein